MSKTRALTIEVPEDYIDRLSEVAGEANRSVSEIAQEALAVYLETLTRQRAAIEQGLDEVSNGAVPVDHGPRGRVDRELEYR